MVSHFLHLFATIKCHICPQKKNICTKKKWKEIASVIFYYYYYCETSLKVLRKIIVTETINLIVIRK